MKSFDEAFGLLGTAAYTSVESLVQLVKEMDGRVIGATQDTTFLLYSGKCQMVQLLHQTLQER